MPPPHTTAASRVPSAEEAMANQFVLGTVVGVHVLPPFVEV